jgi:hypothetical protein
LRTTYPCVLAHPAPLIPPLTHLLPQLYQYCPIPPLCPQLAGPLRTRLLNPTDLRPEWDTLRAGVPGSYVVLQQLRAARCSRSSTDGALLGAGAGASGYSSTLLLHGTSTVGGTRAEHVSLTAPCNLLPAVRTTIGQNAGSQADSAAQAPRPRSANQPRAHRAVQGVLRMLQMPGSPATATIPAGSASLLASVAGECSTRARFVISVRPLCSYEQRGNLDRVGPVEARVRARPHPVIP